MLDLSQQKNQKPTPQLLVISELKVNSPIFGWLFAAEVMTRTTVKNKTYLQMTLRDMCGSEIIARHFDPPRSVETHLPQEGKVILLEGIVEEYRNQLQIKLLHAETDESIPCDIFTMGTRCSIAQLEADFQHLMDKVDHPGLCELLHLCFTPQLMTRFRRWPAAMRHHGAVIGGLLEHTVNVTTIAELIGHLYPCNHDLILAGALLHDIGKLEELEEGVGIGYTPIGRMLGHIVLGVQFVQMYAQHVSNLDAETREYLLHIILAHHTKDFGSPVNPATIEALIVHQADATEARLTGFLEHCQRTAGANGWTTYSSAFGGQLRLP